MLEIQSYLSGLTRNYVRLQDYDMLINYTIKRILGKDRVEAIEAVQVDQRWNFVPGTEAVIPATPAALRWSHSGKQLSKGCLLDQSRAPVRR